MDMEYEYNGIIPTFPKSASCLVRGTVDVWRIYNDQVRRSYLVDSDGVAVDTCLKCGIVDWFNHHCSVYVCVAPRYLNLLTDTRDCRYLDS